MRYKVWLAFFVMVGMTFLVPVWAQVCIPPPSGMVSWWPGDGNANDIQDGNNGTLINGATFAVGKVGPAFSFDGIDDAVDIPRNPAVFALTRGTVDMWVRVLDLNSFQTRLFSIAEVGPAFPISDQWSIDYRTSGPGFGSIEVALVSNGDIVSAGFTPLDTIHDTDFHHIAVVADGVGTIEVYVDGVLQPLSFPLGSPADFFFAHATNADNMKIGAVERDQLFAEGAKVIDEVEIFERPLSSSEIQAIFNAGIAGKCKDADGDGVPDTADQCPNSNINPTVVIAGCNSGVPNSVFPNGCTIADRIAQCAAGAQNHGQFVSCVAHLANELKRAGVITGQQKGAIQSCAGQANIP